MSYQQVHDDFYVDANGRLTERVAMPDGPGVVIHYDHVPESDVTVVDGIRCTTPLRTVIDLAPELDRTRWEEMVRTCLDRRLFTRAEAMSRVSEPDMVSRPGAQLLRQILNDQDAAD